MIQWNVAKLLHFAILPFLVDPLHDKITLSYYTWIYTFSLYDEHTNTRLGTTFITAGHSCMMQYPWEALAPAIHMLWEAQSSE